MLSIWKIVTDAIIPVQLLQSAKVHVCRCLSDVPWSHDSKFCLLRVYLNSTEDTATSDWQLMLCKADGTLAHSLGPGPVQSLRWSPIANILAFTANSCLKLWDASAATLALVRTGSNLEDVTIDWSPSGQHYAVACSRGWISDASPWPRPRGRYVSCVVSAAGDICWAGNADIGYKQHAGLVEAWETRWSATGDVCLGTAASGQEGVVLLPANGSFDCVSTGPVAHASVSSCSRAVVSATSRMIRNHVFSQGSADSMHEIASKQLPFKVPSNTFILSLASQPQIVQGLCNAGC